MPKATFTESAIFPEIFLIFIGLRKQATFCNANTQVFPRNVMKRCYLDLCGASNWSAVLLQPIQSTTSYFISIYTPLCTIAEQCQCLSTSSTPCFHTIIPLANPLSLIQYSSLLSTFSKTLVKCLSCFILICGCGTLEGVVILVYSF